jgi:hypothetical protein
MRSAGWHRESDNEAVTEFGERRLTKMRVIIGYFAASATGAIATSAADTHFTRPRKYCYT